jgi:WD40 repeat protein
MVSMRPVAKRRKPQRAGATAATLSGLQLGASSLRLSSGRIRTLAFSPDGRLLAACDDRGGASLFATSTGTLDKELPAPPGDSYGPVEACAFSPDGALFAVSRAAPLRHGRVAHVTLYVFDVASGEVLFARAEIPRKSLAFSPDGRLLATGASGQHPVLLLDPRTGETRAAIDVDRPELPKLLLTPAVCFSRDGSLLAAWDAIGVRVYDVDSGEERASFPLDHATELATFTDSGDLIAFTTDEVFELRSGAKPARRGPLFSSRDIHRVSSDASAEILAVGYESSVLVGRWRSDAAPLTLEDAHAWAVSTDGKLVGLANGVAAKIIEIESGHDSIRAPGHSTPIRSIHFDDDEIVTVGPRERLVWDARTGAPRRPKPVPRERAPTSRFARGYPQRLGRDLVLLLKHSNEEPDELWDVQRGELRVTYESGEPTVAAALSPDGNQLARTLFRNSTVLVHPVTSNDVVARWELSVRGGMPRVVWSPDGASLAAASDRTELFILPLAKRKGRRELGKRGCALAGLVWSPDGSMLAAADGKYLRLWTPRGALMATVRCSWVVQAFSPDSKRLALNAGPIAHVVDVAEILGIGR